MTSAIMAPPMPPYEPSLATSAVLVQRLRTLDLAGFSPDFVYLPVDDAGRALARIDDVEHLPDFLPLATSRATPMPSMPRALILPGAGAVCVHVPLAVVRATDRVAVIDLCRGDIAAWNPIARATTASAPWPAVVFLTLLFLAGINALVELLLVGTVLLGFVLKVTLGVVIDPGALVLGGGIITGLWVVRRSRTLFSDASGGSPLLAAAQALSPWRQPRSRPIEAILASLAGLQCLRVLLLPLSAGNGSVGHFFVVASAKVLLAAGGLALWRAAARRPEARVHRHHTAIAPEIDSWISTAGSFLAVGACTGTVLTGAWTLGVANVVYERTGLELPPMSALLPLVLQLLAAMAVFRGSLDLQMRAATAAALVLGVIIKAQFGDVGGGLFTVVMLTVSHVAVSGADERPVLSVLTTLSRTGLWAALGRIIGTLVGGILFGIVGASIGEPLGELVALLRVSVRSRTPAPPAEPA